MQKKKIFLNLLLLGVVILGIGGYCYFKNNNGIKYSNVENFKYDYYSNNKVWGQGTENNGLETCRYKEVKMNVQR